MDLARTYITIAGVLGIATGILGFADNPFIGEDAIFATDTLHDAVHIVTGLVALGIGLLTTGDRLARGIIWFGAGYVVLFVVLLISPTLFGLMAVRVNWADHLLHAGLGLVTIAIGRARLVHGEGIDATPAAAGR